jgi:hypothetical protein
MQLEVGARGPETNFVTACFVLDDPLAQQILAVLPPVIPTTPDDVESIERLVESARRYVSQGKAKSARCGYRASFAGFEPWCTLRTPRAARHPREDGRRLREVIVAARSIL